MLVIVIMPRGREVKRFVILDLGVDVDIVCVVWFLLGSN